MSKLFEPITINHLALKNRLVMPPMATAKADADDRVTDEVCDYADSHFSRPSGPHFPASPGHIKRPVDRSAEQRLFRSADLY